MNLHIYEPCSPSTECPPIQCLKAIAQIVVGWAAEGGASLIWPNRVCDADQGMEFRILSLTTEYSVASFTFSIFNRVSFWTGRQCKEVMTCIYLWCQVFFTEKKLIPWFHFEKKNLFCMQSKMNQGHRIRHPSVLNRVYT